jgi:predicted phage terminase large subunit-like protein
MSIDFSERLSRSTDAELSELIGKLQTYKQVRRQTAELDRTEFRRRYPTPGAFAKAYQPSTRQTPALDAIDGALVDLAEAPGATGRQMIFVPPQEGKSTRTSCWFPLWMLAQDPTLRIAIVSYSAEKAERWGKWIRRMIEQHPELGIELVYGSTSASNFETSAGGRVISVGVEGGITGEPVDLLVIDDPLRGRAEAESPTYRKRAWAWWESDSATRLSSRARVVLMLTRWHADDLAGRLMEREPGEWKVLRIPAVRDQSIPLVRGSDGASAYSPAGELISVQGRAPGYFLKLKKKRSLYVWNSIYMQTPVAAEGNLFARADFRYWQYSEPDHSHHDAVRGYRVVINGVALFLGDMTRFVTMDLAESLKASADWTVASVWAISMDGQLILLDRKRQRVGESDHCDFVKPLCVKWAAPDVYVEKGFIGATFIRDATMAGIRIQPVTPDTDKVTRAIPAANRIRSHTVFWPEWVIWLDEWEDEIAGFPTWAHDDQVDTFSYAARIASAHWTPPPDDPDPAPARRRTDTDQAYEAATGLPSGVNFTTAEW